MILRKTNIVSGAASPLHTHWSEPHPDWLRNDLYESDGITLVMDRKARKKANSGKRVPAMDSSRE